MKRILVSLLSLILVCGVSPGYGQTLRILSDSQSTSTSGTSLTFADSIGTSSTSMEVLITGTAPGTISVTTFGCFRGGTCSAALNTYTTVANTILVLSPTTVYDNYKVTISWTAGDATTTVKVNRLSAIVKFGGTGGGFTPPVVATQSANGATLEKFKRFTDSTPTGFFSLYRNAADSGTLFSVDVLGAVVGTSFSVGGATTAGVDNYAQGPTNAGASPCTIANSICEQAPGSVTSYVYNKVAGPASGIINVSNSSSVLTASLTGDANHFVHVVSQVATKTIYTLCPAAAGGCNIAGQYRVTWYFNQGGTACGTPGTGGTTFALSWTDNAGAHSAVALPMDDSSSLTATGTKFTFQTSNTAAWASGVFTIWSTGAQPIQVTNTYTACSVGTGTWELTAATEQIG